MVRAGAWKYLIDNKHVYFKKMISTSLANIGKQIGKRDHSTVIHACKTIENKIKEDNSIKELIDKIERN